MPNKEQILIVGAGLCGSLLSLRLAQQGYRIQLVEKRADMRLAKVDGGRSINLAFSNRGIKGIRRVGLEDKVDKLCIPMHGRMLHDEKGNTQLSKYSGRENEYINSISRSGLNSLLLDELDDYDNVKIYFNSPCKEVDLKKAEVEIENQENHEKTRLSADYLIGTDGAGSVVRKSMQAQPGFLFSHSQNFLTHGYKELSFPATDDDSYATYKNALHIWPRGENMLIALPNLDKSFTVTLFLAYHGGDYNFNNLTTADKLEDYFKEVYPDAYELMPQLRTEFFENPTAPLGTVRCSPWHYEKSLIMGDAAHAIVPFYGQGMNASFEDVVVFDDILKDNDFDLTKSFEIFSRERKKDADAIADLALDNFHEMKSHTAKDLFLAKRKIELSLEENSAIDYYSKYSLVTFKEDKPYSFAINRGRAQDKAILKLLKTHKLDERMQPSQQLKVINEKTAEILEDDALL
ncbi:MAG: NAD(P)/FAD-dependent oxidoreductase [Psychroflexus sp.]|nr:NAD(P)/FAD-dependent oxidoreductase [Psychroflexus sp.]MDR9447785.1 NAD(P)/FAD-dependent oxidoreductase [Psychroflexus sp.]